MPIRYNGIQLTAPAAAAFTADQTIWGWDVIVTATAAATITGADNTLMASLTIGVPFRFGGTHPLTGEPIRLADYKASSAGNVHIAFAIKT